MRTKINKYRQIEEEIIADIKSGKLKIHIVLINTVSNKTDWMDGTVIFQNFPNALAPSTLAASYKSSETPLNAAVIIIVKNGTPYHILATIQDNKAVFLSANHPIGSLIIPIRLRISLITPDVPLNIHRHIIPMTNPETAQGKNTKPW